MMHLKHKFDSEFEGWLEPVYQSIVKDQKLDLYEHLEVECSNSYRSLNCQFGLKFTMKRHKQAQDLVLEMYEAKHPLVMQQARLHGVLPRLVEESKICADFVLDDFIKQCYPYTVHYSELYHKRVFHCSFIRILKQYDIEEGDPRFNFTSIQNFLRVLDDYYYDERKRETEEHGGVITVQRDDLVEHLDLLAEMTDF